MSASNRTGDRKLSLFRLSWAAEIIWLRLSNPHNKVRYGQFHASSISYQTDLLAFSSWYNSIGDVEECWMLKVQFWTTARSDREDVWSHNLTSLALVSTLRIMNFSSRTIWYMNLINVESFIDLYQIHRSGTLWNWLKTFGGKYLLQKYLLDLVGNCPDRGRGLSCHLLSLWPIWKIFHSFWKFWKYLFSQIASKHIPLIYKIQTCCTYVTLANL